MQRPNVVNYAFMENDEHIKISVVNFTGILFSGLSMMLLLGLVNIFLGSRLLYEVLKSNHSLVLTSVSYLGVN